MTSKNWRSPSRKISSHSNSRVRVPVGTTYRQRQLLRQAAQVSGVRVVAFIPEPMSAAIAHSLDISPPSNQTEPSSEPQRSEWHKIFLSVGSRNTQGCLVRYSFTEQSNK